jgi:FXSXX-COOH protein
MASDVAEKVLDDILIEINEMTLSELLAGAEETALARVIKQVLAEDDDEKKKIAGFSNYT